MWCRVGSVGPVCMWASEGQQQRRPVPPRAPAARAWIAAPRAPVPRGTAGQAFQQQRPASLNEQARGHAPAPKHPGYIAGSGRAPPPWTEARPQGARHPLPRVALLAAAGAGVVAARPSQNADPKSTAQPKATPKRSSRSRSRDTRQRRRPPPFDAHDTGGRAARYPEELGFMVSKNVATKGYEIGTMEDGIIPCEDDEPDVFMSHSYSDNCRRVDMARFTCNCPSKDICCSHNYAAIVALPGYRHRACFLWSLQYQMKMNQKKNKNLSPKGLREEIKKDMKHLPMDDTVDAIIDAALGLWTRVEHLRQGLGPRQRSHWLQLVKESLSKCESGDIAMDPAEETSPGKQALARMGQLLNALDLTDQDLAPCLLALSRGAVSGSDDEQSGPSKPQNSKQRKKLQRQQRQGQQQDEEEESEWRALSESMWDYITAGIESVESKPKGNGVSKKELRQIIDKVVAEVEVDDELWSQTPQLDRLWRVEELVLESFGASSFPELRVPREVGADAGGAAGPANYRSFLEALQDPTGEDLKAGGLASSLEGEDGAKPTAPGGGGGQCTVAVQEATEIMRALGGDISALGDHDAAVPILAEILSRRFGMPGSANDWAGVAEEALKAAAAVGDLGSSSTGLVPVHAVSWEDSAQTPASGRLQAIAGEGGFEAAATRLVNLAPPLTELRGWLLWDAVFEAQLGSLRELLGRVASSIGIIVFELPSGDLLKVDAAAGTSETWQSALLAADPMRAAEALLAFCHACGGVRNTPLPEAFGPSLQTVTEQSDPEDLAGLLGSILGVLPAPVAQNSRIARFLLSAVPAGRGPMLAFVRQAGRYVSESAGLLNEGSRGGSRDAAPSAAPALAEQAVKRLQTGVAEPLDGAIVNASIGLRARPKQAAKAASKPRQQQPPSAAASVVEASATPGQLDEASEGEEEEEAAEAMQQASVPSSAPPQAEMKPKSQTPLPRDPSAALIASIRLDEFGFDGEALTGGQLQVRQNARLARALKRLAGELYGSDVHWQLELLQNADDNSYEEDLDPTAQFMLSPGEVVFRCNELGFREADIRAICDIGNSSKVGTAKYAAGGRVIATGEKGLGFKAVFALTDTPCIYSGPYRLKFDACHSSGIGYVLPEFLGGKEQARIAEDLLEDGWGSALRLPLRPDLADREAELFTRLADIPPSLLLFLKKLRDVSVIDSVAEREGLAESQSIHMRKGMSADVAAEARWKEVSARMSIEVCRGNSEQWESEEWLLLRRRYDVPEGVTKPGMSVSPRETLLEIALPLNQDGAFDATRGKQPVFAFLPVRSYDFNFALQGDWAVSSSREELLEGSPWNEFLKGKLPKLMVELVDEVKKLPSGAALRWSFYGAFPTLSSSQMYFRSAVAQVLAALRNHACILTDEDSFCLPQLAHRCSSEVRDALSQKAVGETDKEGSANSEHPVRAVMRSQGVFLINEKVEAAAPAGLLDSLGVQRFGAAQLLRFLPAAAEAKPGLQAWRVVLALLDELLGLAPLADAAALLETAKKLPILPLESGEWSAASQGVFLPPTGQEAVGFPAVLLRELHAVNSSLLEDPSGEDALVIARLRRLLKRLGVSALTPRQVVREMMMPMFQGGAVPRWVNSTSLPKPVATYLALADLVAKNKDLADELVAPLAWPLEGLEEVAIGKRGSAPALHSPSATKFKKVLEKCPAVPARFPGIPEGWQVAELGEVLETMGLALPGPLVAQVPGPVTDWQSEEFRHILEQCASEKPRSAGVQRARLLAESLSAAWHLYSRYARKSDGTDSTFLKDLREKAWLPADDLAKASREGSEKEPQTSASSMPAKVHRPSDLCANTPEIRAVFPEASLLAGRLTTAVEGEFAEALGVATTPSVPLAISVLQSFRLSSPVGSEAAAALYSYLQRERADLSTLRDMPIVVIAREAPALRPLDAVWEDDEEVSTLPALLPLYGSRWKSFFVDGLGVPEQPTPEQMLRRVDQLSSRSSSFESDAARVKVLWPVLLHIATQLAEASNNQEDSKLAAANSRSQWHELAETLISRRCIPLTSGDIGTPSEGALFSDDCPWLPPKIVAEVKASTAFAAEPDMLLRGSQHWHKLLRALGLRPLSEACDLKFVYDGLKKSREMAAQVASLLPHAQLYLYQKYRSIHDSGREAVSESIRQLQCRDLASGQLQLQCNLHSRPGDTKSFTTIVDAALQVEGGVPILIASPQTPMPVICVEIAQLLCPPAASGSNQADALAVRYAREALRTYLASAAVNADSMNVALGLTGEVPEDARWPRPGESEAAKPAADAAPAEDFEVATRDDYGNTEEHWDEDNWDDDWDDDWDDEDLAAELGERDSAAKGEGKGKRKGKKKGKGEGKGKGGGEGEGEGKGEGKGYGEQGKGAGKGDGEYIEGEGRGYGEYGEGEGKGYGEYGDGEGKGYGEYGEGEGKGQGQGKGKRKGGDGSFDGLGAGKGHHRDEEEASSDEERKGKGKRKGKKRKGSEALDDHDSNDEAGAKRSKTQLHGKTLLVNLDELRKVYKLPQLPYGDGTNTLSEEEAKAVGRWGEEFVTKYLQNELKDKRVVWLNETEELGKQHDVQVENPRTGEVEQYIEVKATRASDKRLFEMSYKEWNFAQHNGDKFSIYRVMKAGDDDVSIVRIFNPFRRWKEHNLTLSIGM